MNAHQLAEILLKGDDYPIAIPTIDGNAKFNFVQDIQLYQHDNSPFEYCLLLSSMNAANAPLEIEVPD